MSEQRRSYVLGGAVAVIVAGLVAALLVLFLDGGGHAPTRAEYISKVNAICRVYNARLSRIPAPTVLGNPQAVAQSIGQALPLVVERAEKVRAIEPPKELAARVARLFRFSDMAVSELRTSRRAALAGNVKQSGIALGRFLAFSNEAHQTSLRIGLSC